MLRQQQAQDRARLSEVLDTPAEQFTPEREREARDLTHAVTLRTQQIEDAETAEAREGAAQRAAFEHGEVGRSERAGAAGSFYTRGRDGYDAESDRTGRRSWFADQFNAQVRGDVTAGQRLSQYEAENRATTTASYGGLVVPQYLVDLAALIARASRPFANTCMGLELPEQGMMFDIPRSTTGASVASQNGQNTIVQNTDEVWTDLQTNVATIAGQQDVSRQSLERGTPGLDALVMQDLAAAYYAELDRQVINGSGAAGQLQGVLGTVGIGAATAYGAAITTAKFGSKVAGAATTVLTTRLLPASHLAVAPRRWGWLCAQVDSTGRPIIVPSQSERMNAVGSGDLNPNTVGDTGFDWQGLRVVVDPNVPVNVGTLNEDVSIAYRAADLLLFESGDGTPRQLRFEQTLGGQLTVKVVVYGYSAFSAGRYPTAVALTGGADGTAGNGQIAPTF
jgi:HK97 family phage major capsid protein